MPSVFIVGHKDYDITSMFLKQGWEISTNSEEADLLQFTGGEDVTPALYGEGKHPTTDNNPDRDAFESDVYHYYIDKPKAGICRGGQFLNVMNGARCGNMLITTLDPIKPQCLKVINLSS